MSAARSAPAVWRAEIDSLEFAVDAGACVIHRLAFRTLVDGAATPEACLAFFSANRPLFLAAARTKIARDALPSDARFHLTSRDLKRASDVPQD